MLTRSSAKEVCECCSRTERRWLYRWHDYRYCVTCLHSIGRDTAGNYCSARKYAAAWRELAA